MWPPDIIDILGTSEELDEHEATLKSTCEGRRRSSASISLAPDLDVQLGRWRERLTAALRRLIASRVEQKKLAKLLREMRGDEAKAIVIEWLEQPSNLGESKGIPGRQNSSNDIGITLGNNRRRCGM